MFFGAYRCSIIQFSFFSFLIVLDMFHTFFSFFSPSVLKILSELNTGLPSKVVEDFSMATHRNNTVSVMLFYLLGLLCVVLTTELVYRDHESASSCPLWHWWEIKCDSLVYSVLVQLKFDASAFHWLQPASQVTVTSSGRTVKKRFHQLDDDPDQEVPKWLHFTDPVSLQRKYWLCWVKHGV